MYKMVEDVEVTINSSYQTKKVLYLTNSQCSQFNERNIAKCVQAMDLGPLKFIIRLQSCMSTSNTIIAQAQRLHMPEGTYLKSAALSGVEISTRDNLEVMRQLTLWVKECILPIAIQNKALVITWANTECAMGAAVSEVFIPEQQRLGLSCPFRVLGWTEEPQHHYCAVNGIGLAGQLFQNTSRWKDRREITRQANPASDEDLPRADITNCCDRIVILENMNPHELRQGIPNPKEYVS